MSFGVENIRAGGASFEARLEEDCQVVSKRGLSDRPDQLHSYVKAEQDCCCVCTTAICCAFSAVFTFVTAVFAGICAFLSRCCCCAK
jgi:hypothetical protein